MATSPRRRRALSRGGGEDGPLESTEPALAASELRKVKARTLVMFGDDDLVTIDHMATLYEGIADSELAIVPGTSHFLLQRSPACSGAIAKGANFDAVHPVGEALRDIVPSERIRHTYEMLTDGTPTSVSLAKIESSPKAGGNCSANRALFFRASAARDDVGDAVHLRRSA